jgi:hypothetical protein
MLTLQTRGSPSQVTLAPSAPRRVRCDGRREGAEPGCTNRFVRMPERFPLRGWRARR